MWTNTVPRRWRNTNGGRGTIPRTIRLADEMMLNSGRSQARGYFPERLLIGDGQDDRVGLGREVAGRGLAGGVHDLGAEEAQRQVSTNDDVVGKCVSSFAAAFLGTEANRRGALSRR